MGVGFIDKTWLLVTVTLLGSLSLAVQGAEESRSNEMSLMYLPPSLELNGVSASTNWQEQFGNELAKNQNILFDRLGPPAGFGLTREVQTLRYHINEEIASRGQGVFQSILQNSAQETALAIFPVAEWMEILPLEEWQTFGERLLQGAFGNSAEKEIGDLPSTYTVSESAWRNAGKEGTFRYGIRPRTAPYLYLASELGHFDNRPLLSLEGRVRYLPFNRFQTSLAATAALPYAFELSLSALCEPLQSSHTTATAVRLQRVLGTGVSACAIFLGVSRSAAETGVFFGLSKPW
jgi:hypothetical protein